MFMLYVNNEANWYKRLSYKERSIWAVRNVITDSSNRDLALVSMSYDNKGYDVTSLENPICLEVKFRSSGSKSKVELTESQCKISDIVALVEPNGNKLYFLTSEFLERSKNATGTNTNYDQECSISICRSLPSATNDLGRLVRHLKKAGKLESHSLISSLFKFIQRV